MEMVKSLVMSSVYCPVLTCIQEGWVSSTTALKDFRLSVKSSRSNACVSFTGFHRSGSNIIISVHCSG